MRKSRLSHYKQLKLLEHFVSGSTLDALLNWSAQTEKAQLIITRGFKFQVQLQ